MTASTLSLPVSAAPRFATTRNPARATFGPQVDAVAAALGHPSMPWQQLVNAVANEVNDDGSFAYPIVVCSTPRQAGKTTLLQGILAHRCMTLQDFRAWYTAQSGSDARDTWSQWHQTLAQRLGDRWQFRLSNGEETATWKATGSFIRTFPPTADALHGKQSDFAALDEVWDYSMEQGNAIVQAVVPTQATRPRRQLWIVSTAGTADSLWMRGWIEKARASLGDPDTRIAYFEWSAPEDAPWDDPDTWARFHPAYGRTIDHRYMADQVELMGEDQFRRAFLNQWPVMGTDWQAAWAGLDTGVQIPSDAFVHIAADASWNRSHVAVAAAGQLPDGRTVVEVIDHRRGTDWVVERLVELNRRHRSAIVLHRRGPLGFLVEDLQRAGVKLAEATESEFGDATARFQQLVSSGLLVRPADPRLDTAVANVASSGTDRPVWRRRASGVDISPLTAAAFAAWKASAPPLKPTIHSAPKLSGSS